MNDGDHIRMYYFIQVWVTDICSGVSRKRLENYKRGKPETQGE